MKIPSVGHIDFLNVLPLSVSYEHGADEGLKIVRGVPSKLNEDIISGKLDVSNVSSIIYAKHSDKLVILPEICVSSDGAVQSILLISKKPVESLSGEKIILTKKSATSHCLLKIILQKKYSVKPIYEVGQVAPENPIQGESAAALLIGDDALWSYHHRQEKFFYYDLGEQWKNLTGKKMVYALWTANQDFANSYPNLLKEIHSRIKNSFRAVQTDKKNIIESILDKKNFTYAELDSYLGKTIRWNLSADYIEGLKTFYNLAYELNLIENIPKLKFAVIP